MKRAWTGTLLILLAAAGLWVAASALLVDNALRRPSTANGYSSSVLAKLRSSHPGIEASSVSIPAADGIALDAWWLVPGDRRWSASVRRPAVIVLHGIADTRKGAAGHASYLLESGYAVLLPDSRGHGKSGGDRVTFGVLEREDVRRWADWMRAQGASDVYGIGVSLGAAILLQAAPSAGFAAAVAESPFSCFSEIAAERVLGLRPLVMSAFFYANLRYGVDLATACPERSSDLARTPVLLIHGTADRNIPISHSRRLAALDPTHVRFWEVPDAGHVEVLGLKYREYSRRVLELFENTQRENRTTTAESTGRTEKN